MSITHGAVRRASGAGPGWANFQTSGCLRWAKKREIEAGYKIREEMQSQEIKDKRPRENMRRRAEEEQRKESEKTGKGYEKKFSAGEDNRGC